MFYVEKSKVFIEFIQFKAFIELLRIKGLRNWSISFY
jgi:hypothetical protein